MGESNATLIDIEPSSVTTVENNNEKKIFPALASSQVFLFPDALSMLADCSTALFYNTLIPDGVVISATTTLSSCPIRLQKKQNISSHIEELPAEMSPREQTVRHGISRYAPYGTRFGAMMPDGNFKTSHIAGDLANRARNSNGRGARCELVLVVHEGETEQLKTAWAYCERVCLSGKQRPGPSDVMNFLRDSKIDFDYRKGNDVRLYLIFNLRLQRNASNFYKRMMDYGRKTQGPTVSSDYDLKKYHQQPPRSILMDLDLSLFMDADYTTSETIVSVQSSITNLTPCMKDTLINYEGSDSLPDISMNSDNEFEYALASEDELDCGEDKHDGTFSPLKRKRTDVYSGSRSTTFSERQVKGISSKGLSRYSPYGTRFCAEMDDHTVRESFLAGELLDRSRVRGGKRGGLRLVLHPGEIKQLETAWDFIKSSREPTGAANVLEHLRAQGLDINHRKEGARLLQKNAGNFLKRVQEFGKRRDMDDSYLRVI